MKNALLMLTIVLVVAGCQTMAGTPSYSVVLKNGTSNRLVFAQVRYGNFKSLGGGVKAGQKKVDALVPFPIPEQATVFWQSQDGKSHQKNIDVLKNLPKGFNEGDIIFTILDGDNVSVTNKPFLKLPQNWKVVPK